MRRRWTPWLFLAPALGFGALFYAWPIAAGLAISLADWNPLGAPHWAGLVNYAVLLAGTRGFWAALGNTVVLAVGSTALGVPAALALAVAMQGVRGRSVWRALFWLPSLTNVVAVGYAWRFVLDPGSGVLNRLLALAGIAGPDWLDRPGTAMACLVAVTAWMSLGTSTMLLAGALDGLDPLLLDAARMDGATPWQALRLVVLPLLRPALAFVGTSTLIAGTGGFALVLVLTEGGPNESTTVAALAMYRLAFEDLRLGRAAAVAFVLLAVTGALAALQLRLTRERR